MNQTATIPTDAEGRSLHDGDRVYAYGFRSERCYGTLHYGYCEFVGRDEWYVEYDNDEEFLVLDFKSIWKA